VGSPIGRLCFDPIRSMRRWRPCQTSRPSRFRGVYSRTIDKDLGLRCDQTIVLSGIMTSKEYTEKLRRVGYFDDKSERRFSFLTNNFIVPALVVAELYRCRWQVELFFKWIKQHLRIKSFYGTSENAVKTQIWIAVSVYVLVAIVKKKMKLEDLSLYTILQILSVTLFEKASLLEVLTASQYNTYTIYNDNQLRLFSY